MDDYISASILDGALGYIRYYTTVGSEIQKA